jgi:hypothetical protein
MLKVKHLSTEEAPKRLMIRWATFKGLAAIILFLVITTLIEYVVALYAISLGVRDMTTLQWSAQFPGTDWILNVSISPLFHLVPLAVIITLLFSWIYLTKHVAVKPQEVRKGIGESVARRTNRSRLRRIADRVKSGLLRVRGISYLWQKIHFARATTKGASVVLLTFAVFILIMSLFAYPRLIYQTITSAYQNNPSLLGFVKGSGEALSPIGQIFSIVTNAILSAAPGFRDLALGFGMIIKPFADLDNSGKYLLFQNVAAWVSAFTALFYGEYVRRTYRYRKRRS